MSKTGIVEYYATNVLILILKILKGIPAATSSGVAAVVQREWKSCMDESCGEKPPTSPVLIHMCYPLCLADASL